MNINESSYTLDDNKQEKIGFIIDMTEEIFSEDFQGFNNEKIDRFRVIFEALTNYIKLKDYIAPRNVEFSLYIYKNELYQEIDFCSIKEFIHFLNQIQSTLQTQKKEPSDFFDLGEIYSEAFSQLEKINNETIVRFILFYNRSNCQAIISNEKEYNLVNFIRMTNFALDIIFLRKKINNEADKKTLSEVYNSLTIIKPKFWYAFENSCNLIKFKFIMNVLLANVNQRVKLSELEKYQKNVDEIVKNLDY